MDVKFHKNPVPYLVFRNLFPKPVNSKILEEVLSLESTFGKAYTGSSNKVSSTMRTNNVIYLDDIYNKVDKSFFLQQLHKLFSKNRGFREILASSPSPISDFMLTNTHETQVSRYGDEDSPQFYDWHIDRFSDKSRHVTCVYYFFKEPKEWTGGEIQFTDSPIFDSKTITSTPDLVTIKPENNMAVVFGSSVAHRVLPTKAPPEFDKGRFSANIWIGFK